ncbi:MAG: hypothetical protein V1743_07750 [Nanoarchaeota archaeon]
MGERDYFLVLFLMFVNLLLTNFFTFSSTLFTFELIIICILLVLNIVFIFSRDRQGFAYLFFGLSIINNLYLFFTLLAFLPILLVIINVVILFYLYSLSAVEALVLMKKELKPGVETEARTEAGTEAGTKARTESSFHDVEEVLEGTRVQEMPENVFRSLDLEELKNISSQAIPRSFMYAPEESEVQYLKDIGVSKHKQRAPEELFVEKKPGRESGIMTEHEFLEQEEMKMVNQEYMHVEELGLPEAMEKPLPPNKKFTYQLYYEEPKLTMEFKPIEHLEKKIERKQAAEQLRKKRVREILREEKKPARATARAKPPVAKKAAQKAARHSVRKKKRA